MLKIFVPELDADDDTDTSRRRVGRDSKRRRAISPREGEEVSSIYADIVRPHRSDGSESNRGTSGRIERCLSRAPGKSRAASNDPSVGGAVSTGLGHSDQAHDSGEVVYGPAPNPNDKAWRESDSSGFFCGVCGERVTSQTEDQHRTSTLHIFNQQLRPSERKVQLDESNKGFQLLTGMGWRLDEGLGARGRQGRVNPLQTTFKRDKKGLGAGEKLRPRVTHFPSHVPSQALNAPDGKSDAIRAQEKLDHRRSYGKRFSGGRGQETRAGCGQGRGGFWSDRGASIDKGVAEDVGSGGFWGQGTCAEKGVVAGAAGASAGGSEKPVKGGVRWEGGRKSGQGVDTGSFMGKRERQRREERQKQKEHKTRLELFTDVPEEFAALLFTG